MVIVPSHETNPPITWYGRLFPVAATVLLYWTLRSTAMGEADFRGISYRQYLWREWVAWDEVEEIAWKNLTIVVKLRQPRRFTRRLQFQVHARNLWETFQYSGGRKVPEELVQVRAWFEDSKRAIVQRS